MSRRDLAHVMTALWTLSGEDPNVAVSVTDVDEAIGRSPRDMRTPLNLQALADQGLVVQSSEGYWTLTRHGLARLEQERELSN